MEGRAGLLLFLCSLPGQVVLDSRHMSAEQQMAEAFTDQVFVAYLSIMHGIVSEMNEYCTAYDQFVNIFQSLPLKIIIPAGFEAGSNC